MAGASHYIWMVPLYQLVPVSENEKHCVCYRVPNGSMVFSLIYQSANSYAMEILHVFC